MNCTLECTENGRGLYNDCDLYMYPSRYFTDDDAVIGGTGLQGAGFHIILPFNQTNAGSLPADETW